CGDDRLTFEELEAHANRLAHYLRARGIGRGSFVGIWLSRSMDVYVAMLGALKAGAAYVPLDPDYPEDRVAYILADCGTQALITTSQFASRCGAFKGALICLDAGHKGISAQPSRKLTAAETGTRPDDLCYVIYTSGSTGRPKGVQIEHRSACNLVRAEAKIFPVRSSDRVYQGFSVAFDASVEEIWLAFNAGATLVVGTREMVQSGPELSRVLTEAGVTVFSTVPTLLAMQEEDIPTVRLLIMGGEACPQDLANRWCKPGRRMVNTYGPTEATVIATWGDLQPGRRVTIGKPAPNYRCYILNEQLQPVPVGVPGELCIGGVGVARGYVGQPELTAEKFVPNPFERDGDNAPRLYRTGDLVRWTSGGEIEFLGRLDSQVKLRGFRVELSEIEAVLMECDGVRAAAVAVREDVPGVQQLAGYAVPGAGAAFDEERALAHLRTRLPAYMVPGLIETVAELPTLPSGKVDRRRLPAPRPRAAKARADLVEPRTELEAKIARVWQSLFAPAAVSIHDDFFRELGGHSLLAARMVSELRKDPALRGLSVLDVYSQPTIEKLAAKFEKAAPTREAKPAGEFRPVPRLRHFFCGTAQLAVLYLVYGFFSLQWLAPYVVYVWMIERLYERYEAIFAAVTVLTAFYPGLLLAFVVVKWLVIGRYKAGEHPLWGLYYFRWWLVNTVQSAIPITYLNGTPLLNPYLRLLGAKIGRNVFLGTDNFTAFDLLTIGDDTSIGLDASGAGCHVENGRLIIGPVTIGNGCYVGTRSMVRENAVIEDGAALEDLSMLPAGGRIPRGERWAGSPARPAGQRATARPQPAPAPRRFGFGLLHAVGVVVFPAMVLAAIFPGVILLNELSYSLGGIWFLCFAPVVGLSFVVLLCLEIAAAKWLLLGRVKEGRYPLHSFFYSRKWFVDQLMELSLDLLGPLYASVYLAPWYRLLGAKLGTRAEISTASFIVPDLLSIDDESFIADAVSLGAGRVEDGIVAIAGNRIGKRSFVGNSATLPPGTVLGDDCLIGCLSAPPADAVEAARPGATWLGSPAFFLPQRQQSTVFAVETTFKPTRKLFLMRAAIELLRIILPPTGFVARSGFLFTARAAMAKDFTFGQVLVLFPLLYAGCGVAAAGFAIAMKWLIAGRYQPCEKPLWSAFVWRNELVNALQEHFANDWLVTMLAGTPFISWYFRLMGAKVGRRVYLDTTDMTEFDLVSIGDDAALNGDCTVQTHLFEDRVMKMSRIEIGPRCTVGGGSLVLYDTRMEAGASLGELSLLMKGETLPAGTAWEGSPARPVAHPS
ncbi:MAG: amino acid adenylation domain-containing protein, partial [Verrucomicrobia bacterium]|nr:amino acid adenylation domain-containing protein [Verrucomicrobiota bacterium]